LVFAERRANLKVVVAESQEVAMVVEYAVLAVVAQVLIRHAERLHTGVSLREQV
jgi:Flp pilus assembly pilin Flp